MTQKLLSVISNLSLQYRTKLTTYGFSQSQCNQALLLLCTTSAQNRKQMNLTLKQQSSSNNLTEEEGSKRVFEKVLIEELRKCSGVMRYLQDLTGKLEKGLAQLEELDQWNSKIKIAVQEVHAPEQSSNKSISLNSQQQPCSEADKKSNFASTEPDSLLNHESQIESSLHNLIMKTKILKAMLEKQMLSVQALGMGGRQHYPRSASGSFMA